MVLIGKLNKDIVLRLNRHGQPAVGPVRGRRVAVPGREARGHRRATASELDLGFVGSIEHVDVDVLNHIAEDYIPVVASVGADAEGSSYNVNADEAAGAVAAALGAYKVIFLTDVEGWLADRGRPGEPRSRRPTWPRSGARSTTASVGGGMLPKLQACADAVERGRAAPRTSSTGASRTRCCSSCSRMRASARRWSG